MSTSTADDNKNIILEKIRAIKPQEEIDEIEKKSGESLEKLVADAEFAYKFKNDLIKDLGKVITDFILSKLPEEQGVLFKRNLPMILMESIGGAAADVFIKGLVAAYISLDDKDSKKMYRDNMESYITQSSAFLSTSFVKNAFMVGTLALDKHDNPNKSVEEIVLSRMAEFDKKFPPEGGSSSVNNNNDEVNVKIDDDTTTIKDKKPPKDIYK